METALEKFGELLKNISGHVLLGIGSAEFTNEDNYALIRFLQENFPVPHLAYTAREVEYPSQDDYLISADKNPNRAGVTAMGMKPLASEDRKYQCLIGLGPISESTLTALSFEKDHKVIVFATHREASLDYADLVFPVATFAELTGTMVNRQGRVQMLRPAFAPPGESKTVWEILSQAARLMSRAKPAYTAPEQVFADLAELVPAFKGLNYELIGKQGALLTKQ